MHIQTSLYPFGLISHLFSSSGIGAGGGWQVAKREKTMKWLWCRLIMFRCPFRGRNRTMLMLTYVRCCLQTGKSTQYSSNMQRNCSHWIHSFVTETSKVLVIKYPIRFSVTTDFPARCNFYPCVCLCVCSSLSINF